MPHSIEATFRCLHSEEEPAAGESERPERTRVHGRQEYRGDIAGESTLEYLMVYGADGSATFVGLECVTGSVRGRAGSFVLRHCGAYADGVARMSPEVVEGAGTGALSGLSGSGEFESPHAEEYALALSVSFGDGMARAGPAGAGARATAGEGAGEGGPEV